MGIAGMAARQLAVDNADLLVFENALVAFTRSAWTHPPARYRFGYAVIRRD